MKTNAIVIERQGAPEVMQLKTGDLQEPAAGEVLVKHTAVGLNYIDTYHRSGHYPLNLPSGLGSEAVGIVEAVGEGVDTLNPGERVAYAGGAPGAYCTHRVMGTEKIVRLPDNISDEMAAASMLKGMTVEYLLMRTYPVKKGEVMLFWAAAGGVGLIAGQWARALGAVAIGVAGTQSKCELAREHGYTHVIDHSKEDVVKRVRELTDGRGVPVVYDSVGKATFERSMQCVAPRGLFVSFGNASGDPPAVEASQLQHGGSLYFTRPTLVTYTASRDDLEASAGAVFARLGDGTVKVNIGQSYDLSDAVTAHKDLEAGKTTGSSLLMP